MQVVYLNKCKVACVAGGILVPGVLAWWRIRHAKRGAKLGIFASGLPRGKISKWLVPTLLSTPTLIPPATQATCKDDPCIYTCYSLRGRRSKGKGKGIWGAQEAVSCPNSFPRPFRTSATQAKLADLCICEKKAGRNSGLQFAGIRSQTSAIPV